MIQRCTGCDEGPEEEHFTQPWVWGRRGPGSGFHCICEGFLEEEALKQVPNDTEKLIRHTMGLAMLSWQRKQREQKDGEQQKHGSGEISSRRLHFHMVLAAESSAEECLGGGEREWEEVQAGDTYLTFV